MTEEELAGELGIVVTGLATERFDPDPSESVFNGNRRDFLLRLESTGNMETGIMVPSAPRPIRPIHDDGIGTSTSPVQPVVQRREG